MKIFIAYKFSAEKNKEELRTLLEKLSGALEAAGHSTYIHFRDVEKWGEVELSPDEIIRGALKELKSCDAIFALMMTLEKSEGMLLEVGFAKALDKKIILAIKKGERAVFLKALADDVIEFEDGDDLMNKIGEITEK